MEVTHQVIRYPLGALAAYRDNPTGPAELFTFATQALQANPELGDLLVQLGAGATTDTALAALDQVDARVAMIRTWF